LTRTALVLDALEQAVWTRARDGIADLSGLVHHTDAGPADRIRDKSACLLRYDRTSMRPMLATASARDMPRSSASTGALSDRR
jgi:hypothetical protein